MSLVAVKNKYQVVIPKEAREKIGVNVGDLLEAKVERGKITFTPKSLVDRGVAESLRDFKKGRSYGPFASRSELLASLRKESARIQPRKKTRK